MAAVKDDQVFKTKLAVWEWLVANDWQVGRSVFYDHCRDGYLKPRSKKAGGGYALAAVRRYTEKHCRQAATGEKLPSRAERLNEERAELDLEQSRVKLQKEQLTLGVRQKKYIDREDAELQVVGLAVAFAAGLNHLVQTRAPKWVELVGGDQALVGDLVDDATTAIAVRLSDFCRLGDVDVVLEKNERPEKDDGLDDDDEEAE